MTTRTFQTPKARVFQAPVEEFHANHNQADHGNRAGARKIEAMNPNRASRPRGTATEAANPNRASRSQNAAPKKYEAVPLYTEADGRDGRKARARILSTPAANDPLTAAERSITGPKLEEAKEVYLLEDMDEYAPPLTAKELRGRNSSTFGELIDDVGSELDYDKHLKYWLRTGGQVPVA